MHRADPEELAEAVEDQATFLAFLTALQEDFALGHNWNGNDENTYGINQNGTGWYNGSIDQFLEAAVACATDCEIKEENPWRECAAILLSGKYYE